MKARLISSGIVRIVCGSFLLASALAGLGAATTVSSSASATTPALTVSPPTVNFGNVTLGVAALVEVTVTNQSAQSDTIMDTLNHTGADPDDFDVIPEDTCTTDLEGSVVLPSGSSCTFVAVFLPGGLGQRSATVGFDDTASSGASVSLSGVGTIGYYQVSSAGKVANFGDAHPFGDASTLTLNHPIVSMAQTGDGGGYWLVASDGGIFNYGDAGFFGSAGSIPLNKPIVGMAPTIDGGGYWLVASDGGIFNYGDASFYGSTGSIKLNKPIVGMAPTSDGGGYWLVASDGGIFNYGDAGFFGSAGSIPLNKPIVGMAATPDNGGYWLVASDGGIFAYGDATFYGSTGSIHLNQPIVGMAAMPDGGGYWFTAADGGIFNYGDAPFYGSSAGQGLGQVVAMVSSGGPTAQASLDEPAIRNLPALRHAHLRGNWISRG
jgi:hypothetical protein